MTLHEDILMFSAICNNSVIYRAYAVICTVIRVYKYVAQGIEMPLNHIRESIKLIIGINALFLELSVI